MRYVLELPNGRLIPCHSAEQALALARVFVAIETGKPAIIAPANDKRPAE